ncbi:MAG: acetate uptake transporter [Nocardioidaceae bacterium]
MTVNPASTAEDPTASGGHVPVTAGFSDPAPLGLAGFAMTTFVLSCVNAHLLDASTGGVVLGLALFYGGIAQFAAGLWEFAKGNTFGSTAFCSFGAFWLSFWFLEAHTDLSGASPSQASHAVGTFLLAWAIFTGYMTIAATRTTGAILAVFVVLFLTYIALTIGAFAISTGWDKVGGWLGIVTAFLAWYAAFAGVTNATYKRQVLPTIPL